MGKTGGMSIVHRVLSPEPIDSLELYLARGGGVGLQAARDKAPDEVIAEVEASGLRGRGGAGFPTGRKWRTVREMRSDVAAATVVVNGAEGEPGTLKDRTLLANNPYQVIEGALIAAHAVDADRVVIAVKASSGASLEALRRGLAEMVAAGFDNAVTIDIFEGPSEYLYGEETALLESLDGRPPFPRIAAPYRRGVDEVVESPADVAADSGLSAHVELATRSGQTTAAPTLVDNVETLANIPRIVARGAAWFRTAGTEQSPGTIVCTITGSTQQAGVGEVVMGTSLREVIDLVGGGPRDGHTVKAVLSGVSNAFITADKLDTPLTYEDMVAAGSGLGSCGFIVFDDTDDMPAVVAGASRFLAVESCGQCTPCKEDGLALSAVLSRIARSEADADDLTQTQSLAATVANEARCFLATQHQTVVTSLLESFSDEVTAHISKAIPASAPVLFAELLGIDGGAAVSDERQHDKQPDWSFDAEDSGKWPAAKLDDPRSEATD